MFRNAYPRYPTVEEVEITDDEKTYMMDLRPFMNPSPYTLQHVSTLFCEFMRKSNKIIYKLFFFSLQHCQEHSDSSEAWGFDICLC